MIKIAVLVSVKDNEILVVRVRHNTVSIQCFAVDICQQIKPCAEISEVKCYDLDDKELISSGVIEVIRRGYS
jgi:hypothetical protein